MRRNFLADDLRTSWPRVTCPSPAMTTSLSRRTQSTVVERMRCFIETTSLSQRAIGDRRSAIGYLLLEMLMPALDSVFVIIAIGSSDSFGVLFAWKAASSWLSWLVLLLLEVLLELLSASLDEAWA